MSDLPALNAPGRPEVLQLSDCVDVHPLPEHSPLDGFIDALAALNKMAAGLPHAEHPDVVGQMLIVAVVSETESYFRHVFAALAADCPYCAANVAGEPISFGAVKSYPPHVASLSLLEGVLFSSRGVLAGQLTRFTKFKVQPNTALASAIESYDVVCSLRHSAAHWRGFLDSRAASSLGIRSPDVTSFRLSLSLALVQRAYAVCDFLVRLVNDTLYRLTVRKWAEGGLLQLEDGTEGADLARCRSLFRTFASTAHCAAIGLDEQALLQALLDDRTAGMA